MSDAAETMAERHSRLLGELTELGMGVARDLAGRLAAAEGPDEAQGLARAFHQVSRSVRQSMALESRLERERRQGAAETRLAEGEIRIQAIQQRRIRLRRDVGRMIWTERERDEAERLLPILDRRLAEDSRLDDFADLPVEVHIARLRAAFGLPANDGAGGEAVPLPERRSG